MSIEEPQEQQKERVYGYLPTEVADLLRGAADEEYRPLTNYVAKLLMSHPDVIALIEASRNRAGESTG